MKLYKIKHLSSVLKALSHEDRLKIVCAIYQSEQNVTTIGEITRIKQPSLSAHLKVLNDKEIITFKKDGKEIYYRIKGRKMKTLLESIHAVWCN